MVFHEKKRYNNAISKERSRPMNTNSDKKLTAREKLRIAAATGLCAGIGAVLGVIAYYQQWLG